MNKKRVLMAMSGGLDSSVAAILLLEQGYELVGVTMKMWEYESAGIQTNDTGCCNIDAVIDAMKIATKLGFPHYTLDFKDIFKEIVIKDFVDEYMKGRTPNPCVLCNTFIKWDALRDRANDLECDYIATGHYAVINKENDRFVVKKGADKEKDQSYFLWGISQKNLAGTLFPLGNYYKNEIRQIAVNNGFNFLAEKSESYEICFIPDNDYRSFLKYSVKDIESKLKGGDILNVEGEIIGKHKGYPFYTIGQRKGLDVALGEPAYVTKIDPINNTVTLGFKKDLMSDEMLVKNVNYIKLNSVPKNGMEVTVKIRSHDKGTKGTIFPAKNNSLRVVFEKPVSAITPGQSAVFYENDDIVAGGVIEVV